jgi:hypothetical protein
MFQAGSLLREWNNSSEQVREVLRRDGNASTKNIAKVLGYNYSVTEDSIMLNFTKVNERADTTRYILSEISKVFDPLGLVNPLTVRGKLFSRDLWALKLEWVSDELQKKWVRLCSDLRR